MQLWSILLAIGLAVLVDGQSVGSDGITTVPTATCTTTGTQTYAVTDSQGVLYNYMCGAGSGGNTLTTIPTASVASWQSCFGYCNNYTGSSNCSGFTYYNQGAQYGNGSGQCLLKNGPQSFASTANLIATRIAAYNVRYQASMCVPNKLS